MMKCTAFIIILEERREGYMKIVKQATTTAKSYAKAVEFASGCCGGDCLLKCKKCPPMKD